MHRTQSSRRPFKEAPVHGCLHPPTVTYTVSAPAAAHLSALRVAVPAVAFSGPNTPELAPVRRAVSYDVVMDISLTPPRGTTPPTTLPVHSTPAGLFVVTVRL